MNWESTCAHRAPDAPSRRSTTSCASAGASSTRYTPEFAEPESGVPAETIVEVAREIARGRARVLLATSGARPRPATCGGWQVARALFLLNVLTGAVGTEGGVVAERLEQVHRRSRCASRRPTRQWNELHWPREYPLAHNEMCFLLPHFLKDGRGQLDSYFTRVYNPVWTNPRRLLVDRGAERRGKVGCTSR